MHVLSGIWREAAWCPKTQRGFLDVNNSLKSDIFTGLDPSPCVIHDALRRKQHMVTSGNILSNVVKDVQSDVWLCMCRRRFRFPTVMCPIPLLDVLSATTGLATGNGCQSGRINNIHGML